MGHKSENLWEHEANKDKGPENWKNKEVKEVHTSNVEVLLGCTETIENDNVLFEIDL